MAFDDEEEDDAGADEVAAGEDVAVLEVNVACDEGGEEGEEEVPASGCEFRGRLVGGMLHTTSWRRWTEPCLWRDSETGIVHRRWSIPGKLLAD